MSATLLGPPTACLILFVGLSRRLALSHRFGLSSDERFTNFVSGTMAEYPSPAKPVVDVTASSPADRRIRDTSMMMHLANIMTQSSGSLWKNNVSQP